ncbi:MAG: hypothetical protein KC910_19500 [Candidatus Eremiobacteraeota bacterium]|nr:hypothetical protein [Candidatus Eremiobacteraeota bacterium]
MYRRRQGASTRSERLAVRYGLSPRDFWGTHPDDFRLLDRVFRFGLDAAATEDDALVSAFISPEEDAFAVEWGPRCLPGRPAVFLNPPYSARGRAPHSRGILAWLERAIQQCHRWGILIAMLVPHSPSTRYGTLAHRRAPVLGLWGKRRAYLDPDTRKPRAGNQHASCTIILRPGETGPAVRVYLDELALPDPPIDLIRTLCGAGVAGDSRHARIRSVHLGISRSTAFPGGSCPGWTPAAPAPGGEGSSTLGSRPRNGAEPTGTERNAGVVATWSAGNVASRPSAGDDGARHPKEGATKEDACA